MESHLRYAPRLHGPRPRGIVGGGVALGVALVLAGLVAPDDATPKGGPVLVSENFQSPALPEGWRFDREGVWTVRAGKLHAKLPDRKQERSLAFFGSSEWKNYAVDLDMRQIRGVDKGIVVRVDDSEGVGIDLRGTGYDDIVMYRGFSQLGKASAPNRNGRWYHVRVEVQGNRYRVYVNRALKIDYADDGNRSPAGRLALAAYTGGAGECEVSYDNVVVRPLP